MARFDWIKTLSLTLFCYVELGTHDQEDLSALLNLAEQSQKWCRPGLAGYGRQQGVKGWRGDSQPNRLMKKWFGAT
jgi:hypothetical protein